METASKICAYALGHLNQQFKENRLSPCFRCTSKIGDHSSSLMSHAMNSPEARAHRIMLMSGQWPAGCASCRDFEEAGIRSTRLHGLSDETFDVPRLLSGYDPVTGAISPSNMTSIEIRFGNECNLQCRHCDHVHSSKWEAAFRRRPDVAARLGMDYASTPQAKPPGYYDDIIENIVPNLHTIMFSGGETLYQKQHYEFLDRIPEEHARRIYLTYVTNGTVTGMGRYDVFELWGKFRQVNAIVSTDGTGRLFEYFRHGSSWDTVASNIRAFRQAGVRVTAEITTSVFQILDMPRICEDIYEVGVDQMSSSLVQWPAELCVRLVPDDIKSRIAGEWDGYVASIGDARKRKMVRSAGDMVVGYMKAGNNTGKTWDDFKAYAAVLDDLLETDFRQACPDLAAYLA